MGKCEVIQFINQNCIKNGKLPPAISNDSWWNNRNALSIKEEIFFLTNEYPSELTLPQRIWILKKGLKIAKCKECGKNTKYNKDVNEFREFCSSVCVSRNREIKTKKEETCLKRYNKRHTFQVKEFKQKSRKTCQEKYGFVNHTRTEEFHRKRKSTCLKKYGTEFSFQNEEVKRKWRENNQNKYGVSHVKQIHLDKRLINISDEELENIYNNHIEDKIPVYSISEDIGFSKHKLASILSNKGYNLKRFYSSKLQEDIYKLFSKDSELNNRKELEGLEIDIYFPKYRFGLEIDGIYWHSKDTSLKDFSHVTKIVRAEEKNIKLIRFNEIELNNKKDICLSIINNFLGRSEKKYARKGTVVKVTKQEEKDFFNKNHIQGYRPSSICYGIKFGNEILQMMSFGKSRYNRNVEWEIIRSCNKVGHIILGGFSRLFSKFVKQHSPNSIITYADRRYFTGESYKNVGFEFSHYSDIGYHYYKGFELFNRIKFQKHKLAGLLENFDPSLTEKENMINHGFRIYYDCGQAVYIWKR